MADTKSFCCNAVGDYQRGDGKNFERANEELESADEMID
jgi:hypothetical protein